MADEWFGDWDRHESGDIDSEPLAAFRAAVASRRVHIRLEVRMADGRMGGAQMSMTAHEAAELGHLLLYSAEQIARQPAPPRR